MNIYDALKQDHDAVKKLLQQLSDTGEKAEKTRAKGFDKLKTMLSAHSRAEEEVFYAALREHEAAHDDVLEGEQEHHMVDVLLAEMAEMDVTDEQWTAKLTVLKEQVEHHVEEEEDDLFAKARKILDQQQAEALAEAFKEHKKQHEQARAA